MEVAPFINPNYSAHKVESEFGLFNAAQHFSLQNTGYK